MTSGTDRTPEAPATSLAVAIQNALSQAARTLAMAQASPDGPSAGLIGLPFIIPLEKILENFCRDLVGARDLLGRQPGGSAGLEARVEASSIVDDLEQWVWKSMVLRSVPDPASTLLVPQGVADATIKLASLGKRLKHYMREAEVKATSVDKVPLIPREQHERQNGWESGWQELKDSEQRAVVAVGECGGVDESSAVKVAKVVEKVSTCDNPESVRNNLQKPKQLGFVSSKPGRGWGFWLEDWGRKAFEKEKSAESAGSQSGE